MKKYFFFDIDGTLIPEAGGFEVPKEVHEAIAELQEKGHFCAIATGRAHCIADKVRKALGFDHMVCDGGNGIVLNNELVSLEPLEKSLSPVGAGMREKRIYVGIFPEDCDYMLTRFPNYPACDYLNMKIDENLRIEDYPEIYKMYPACPMGEAHRLSALKHLHWEGYEGFDFLFVEPADKAKGIRKVMDYFQASYEDVVVFGDGLNDLSMFCDDWLCIAMGNAVPEIKERADFITRNASEGGIIHALKHFEWI